MSKTRTLPPLPASTVELVDLLGGGSAVASKLGLGPSAVSMWHTKGIPPKHAAALEEACKSIGRPDITAGVVLKIKPPEAPRPRRTSEARPAA